MLEQLKVQATGLGLFFVGVALAGAWFGVAAFFGLLELMHPAWAAGLIGLIISVVVLLVMAVLRLYHDRQKQQRTSVIEDMEIPNIEALLNGLVDDKAKRFLDQHADRASLIAMALGGVAGYSRQSRAVMLSVVKGMVTALQATQSTGESQADATGKTAAR